MGTHFERNFQYDWLLCSRDGFTIFEVARSKNPDNPLSTVLNKLSDKATNHITTLQFIVSSVLYGHGFLSDEDKQNILFHCIRLIIIFPNSTIDGIRSQIGENKDRILKSNFGQWGHIQLLVPNTNIYDPDVQIVLFDIDNQLNLVESSKTISEIFDPKNIDLLEPAIQNHLSYIAALLSFSYLMRFNKSDDNFLYSESSEPMHVDRKYAAEEGLRNSRNKTYLNIILSPQQHRILSENRKFLFIIGEPGTGKTALLLAKACSTVLHDQTIEFAFFCLPGEKTELVEFIKSFVENHACREILANKFRVIDMKSLASATHHSDKHG